MNITWDPAKNRENQRKHGISFDDAKAVFQDLDRIEVLDDRDYGEERWVAIGTMGENCGPGGLHRKKQRHSAHFGTEGGR